MSIRCMLFLEWATGHWKIGKPVVIFQASVRIFTFSFLVYVVAFQLKTSVLVYIHIYL